MVTRTSGLKTPPLLHAALGGSVEGVEFFLGDAPHRLYGEFGKSKTAREDARLKHLSQSPKGFERAITKWLGADSRFHPPLESVDRVLTTWAKMTWSFTVLF